MEDFETVTDVYSRAGARTVTISELGISDFQLNKSPQIGALTDLRKALLNYPDISADRRRTILGAFFEWDYLTFANMEMLALAIVTYIRFGGRLTPEIMNSDFIHINLNAYLLNANIDVESMEIIKYLDYKADIIRYWDAVANFRQTVREF